MASDSLPWTTESPVQFNSTPSLYCTEYLRTSQALTTFCYSLSNCFLSFSSPSCHSFLLPRCRRLGPAIFLLFQHSLYLFASFIRSLSSPHSLSLVSRAHSLILTSTSYSDSSLSFFVQIRSETHKSIDSALADPSPHRPTCLSRP